VLGARPTSTLELRGEQGTFLKVLRIGGGHGRSAVEERGLRVLNPLKSESGKGTPTPGAGAGEDNRLSREGEKDAGVIKLQLDF